MDGAAPAAGTRAGIPVLNVGYVATMGDTRLDDLQQDIDKARHDAEEAGILPDPDEPRFYESGTIHPELDDQTIAPPG